MNYKAYSIRIFLVVLYFDQKNGLNRPTVSASRIMADICWSVRRCEINYYIEKKGHEIWRSNAEVPGNKTNATNEYFDNEISKSYLSNLCSICYPFFTITCFITLNPLPDDKV